MISRAFMIWRIDIEIACDGTSSIDANQPSPTCCRRQAASSVTIKYGLVRREVGGRIVEREVAVFADADKRDVDGALGDRASRAIGHRRGVPFAVEQVVPRETRLADQPLEQVLAEARRMLDRQADVLVEVKHLDARPVDARRGR
jgi:hypothetical protein